MRSKQGFSCDPVDSCEGDTASFDWIAIPPRPMFTDNVALGGATVENLNSNNTHNDLVPTRTRWDDVRVGYSSKSGTYTPVDRLLRS